MTRVEGKRARRAEALKRLTDALSAAGYFRGADPALEERVRSGDEGALWGVPRAVDGTGSWFNEELRGDIMVSVAPALRAVGVTVTIEEGDAPDLVRIDGRSEPMPVMPDDGDTPGFVRALLGRLDTLCTAAGAPERAYYADSSDGVLLLLTPEMKRAFEETEVLAPWHKPWNQVPPEWPPPGLGTRLVDSHPYLAFGVFSLVLIAVVFGGGLYLLGLALRLYLSK